MKCRVTVVDLLRTVSGLAASVGCILALVRHASGNDHGSLQALIWSFGLLMFSIERTPTNPARDLGER